GRAGIHSIFDLGRYEDVVRYRDYIVSALSKPMEDPGAMPVTRDLAAWKRTMIIAWLTTPGANGLPKRDLEQVAFVEAAPGSPVAGSELMDPGSKTLAGSRSLALRDRVEAAVKPRND